MQSARHCVARKWSVAVMISVGLAFAATAATTSPRLWTKVTLAAGIPIRSAANFRVFAISTGAVTPIDIYQINTNGSVTRLDTIQATASGVYSPGTYVTQNMTAIYWQFSAAPPVSNNPPPVSVTFINDVPAVPLSSLYYLSLPQTPFAATDSSLLLNLDLRTGVPPGWTNNGSGSFDPSNGYVAGVGAMSGLSNTAISAFSSSSAMNQGTVAVRFQRTGVATDNSFGTYFWDSTGNTLNATTQNRQLFQMRSNSGNWSLQVLVAAGSIPALQVKAQTPSMSAPTYFYWQTVNSHYVAGYHDPVFADLYFTWFQNQYYVFFDGHLITAGTLGDVPIYQMFQDVCLGNFNGAGAPSGSPLGAYAIQQFQVSSRFLGPVLAGPMIGLLPDSFAAAYTQRATPTATGAGGTYQVSDIDAVQTALGLYTGMAARTYNPGQSAAFHQIQALMFRNYGFFPPIYDAGQPGHGYSSINAPIDDAYIAALNQASPSLVMAGGTINDVNVSLPSDANLIADTEAVLGRLVNGGGSRIAAVANPALEQLIYLETLSSQAMPSIGSFAEPAYAAESQNIIALTRSSLSGFQPPKGVSFTYVDSREWWNEASAYTTYLYGSAPNDRFNGPGGNDYLNAHPDPSGYSVIAANLYPVISSAVMNSLGANLSITGTGQFISAQSESYLLSVHNAGPLTAAGSTVTTILPSGTSLVPGSSNANCIQTGNTLTCQLGAVATGSTTSVTVVLQTTAAAIGSLAFAVGNLGGNNTNASQNVVTIYPTGSGVSDNDGSNAPLPLWAEALLGACLLGIARLTRRRA